MKNQKTELLTFIERLKNSRSLEDYENSFNDGVLSRIDFTSYYLFDEKEYTRNLLYSDSTCELILICWKHGQKSAVHDHADSECIMCCVDGVLQENHYIKSNGEKPSELVCTEAKTLRPYSLSRINNEIALHQIVNGHNGNSVSLHLYIPGIATCKVYENGLPETTQVNSHFHREWAIIGRRC